jgi:hypothetical protein
MKLSAELEKLGAEIGTQIGAKVKELASEFKALIAAQAERIAKLEAELKNLKESGRHRGIWQEGTKYRAGNRVLQGGSTFECMFDTDSAKPGNGSTAWTLVAARGRDGRDATSAAAPEEPAQRRVATAQRNHPR